VRAKQLGGINAFDKVLVYDYALDRLLGAHHRLEGAIHRQPGAAGSHARGPRCHRARCHFDHRRGQQRLRRWGARSRTGPTGRPTPVIRPTRPTSNLGNTSQNTVEAYGVTGNTEANGNWWFKIMDFTHIDLVGSTFTNAYVSGGAIGRAMDALTFSLESISTNWPNRIMQSSRRRGPMP
jgi:hypothetical protein